MIMHIIRAFLLSVCLANLAVVFVIKILLSHSRVPFECPVWHGMVYKLFCSPWQPGSTTSMTMTMVVVSLTRSILVHIVFILHFVQRDSLYLFLSANSLLAK